MKSHVRPGTCKCKTIQPEQTVFLKTSTLNACLRLFSRGNIFIKIIRVLVGLAFAYGGNENKNATNYKVPFHEGKYILELLGNAK